MITLPCLRGFPRSLLDGIVVLVEDGMLGDGVELISTLSHHFPSLAFTTFLESRKSRPINNSPSKAWLAR